MQNSAIQHLVWAVLSRALALLWSCTRVKMTYFPEMGSAPLEWEFELPQWEAEGCSPVAFMTGMAEILTLWLESLSLPPPHISQYSALPRELHWPLWAFQALNVVYELNNTCGCGLTENWKLHTLGERQFHGILRKVFIRLEYAAGREFSFLFLLQDTGDNCCMWLSGFWKMEKNV